MNASDTFLTEDRLQSVRPALDPSGDRKWAIAGFCEGQEAEVDVVRGRAFSEEMFGV